MAKLKTPQEKFENRISKQNSVECCVILEMKVHNRISWNSGICFKKLKQAVEIRRKRKFSNQRIYEAVSLLNRYGKIRGIYLRSECQSTIDKENNKYPEWRYFIPTEQFDISKEKRDLEHRKGIVELKEDHIEYHETVTIPQEQRLEELKIN